jgi:hypothetical protein
MRRVPWWTGLPISSVEVAFDSTVTEKFAARAKWVKTNSAMVERQMFPWQMNKMRGVIG